MAFLVFTLFLWISSSPERFEPGDSLDLLHHRHVSTVESSRHGVQVFSADTTIFIGLMPEFSSPGKLEKGNITDCDLIYEFIAWETTDFNELNPLFRLIWDDMENYSRVLFQISELTNSFKMISLRAGLISEKYVQDSGESCMYHTWNRNRRNIYNTLQIDSMQWLEIYLAAN